MQLVEQHCIGKSDPRYSVIDGACFASKNLYNAALYEMRQVYIFGGTRLTYNEMDKRMQSHEAYKALPAKVAQQVLCLLEKNWKSYFAACLAYQKASPKFGSHPEMPHYKDKQQGRNVLVYTIQAISKKGLKRGMIQPSGLPIQIKTKHASIDQVRIVPRKGHYVVEVVYEKEPAQAAVDPTLYAAIDIGLNNLVALTSNKIGFVPRLVNGRPIKSINQFYNKRKAELQKALGTTGTTDRMERLTTKRTRRIDHYLHTASHGIIDLLVAEGIGTLCIGKNENWKQNITLGKRTNQNFVQVPHARFIDILTYKAKLVGIVVHITEESYTSKCSFLDMEEVKKHEVYAGKRIERGLFRASTGKQYNADVNGSYNILRKVAPDAFVQRSRGCVVHPEWMLRERREPVERLRA